MTNKASVSGIDPTAVPSGNGCVECLQAGDWWLHLRRCAECGHIGCCDNSPGQHATAHYHTKAHPVIQSFEPGEDWFYDYRTQAFIDGAFCAASDGRTFANLYVLQQSEEGNAKPTVLSLSASATRA